MIFYIYTDGACKHQGTPYAKGGWGVVFFNKERPEEYQTRSGKGPVGTTNNRMELQAVIEALKIFQDEKPYRLVINSDSEYVVKGASIWSKKWIQNGFKKIKNVDLWQELLVLAKGNYIKWQWVKAHAGNTFNELADELANKEADIINNNFW